MPGNLVLSGIPQGQPMAPAGTLGAGGAGVSWKPPWSDSPQAWFSKVLPGAQDLAGAAAYGAVGAMGPEMQGVMAGPERPARGSGTATNAASQGALANVREMQRARQAAIDAGDFDSADAIGRDIQRFTHGVLGGIGT